MSRPKVVIVLPALTEQETIGKVINEIPRQALEQKGYDVSVLVIDGASTDKTGQIAQDEGAQVIIEPRKGKGRAMKTAFEQAKADFVFMLDADYTYPATYIPDMLHILEQGCSVVTGSRLKGKREKGAMSPLHMVGNRLLTLMANILYRKRTSDLCTGYWGFRGEIIPHLRLLPDGFNFEAQLFAQIARKRYTTAEIPINYRRRATPAKLSPLKDGLKIAWTLITGRF